MNPPQPLPDADTAPFWEAARHGRLEVCACAHCQRYFHPPVERCPECDRRTSFEPVSGRGTVHTFIVAERASVPGFADHVPYVVALVELAEQPGLRVPGRLVDLEDIGNVQIGTEVKVDFEPLPPGDFVVPVWRLARVSAEHRDRLNDDHAAYAN